MTLSNTGASALLVENLPLLRALDLRQGILDLACGSGRNGLVLAAEGMPVTFADRDSECLHSIVSQAQFNAHCRVWNVDLELAGTAPLGARQFDAILVFNYLHRPLMPAIRKAVRPGGLVFYETFTVAQRAHGRPANPDFLLKPGELGSDFQDWEVLHSFEGELSAPTRAVANLIARRPETG